MYKLDFRLFAAATFLVSLCCTQACKSDGADLTGATQAADSTGIVDPSTATSAPSPDTRSAEEIVAEMNAGGKVGPLPAFPAERIADWRSKVTKIDLVFFTQGVSMSLDNKESVAYALAAVSPTVSPRRPNCQPIARMFMSVGQESVAEADVFFTEGCTYFEVFEDKKPGYANEMTAEGKAFFNDNLSQAIPGFQRVK